METVKTEIEWICGVIRIFLNQGSFENRDPYIFSATIRGTGGVAEILGVSSTPSIAIAKSLASELKKYGFHTMIWYRYKNGLQKKITINLNNKES